MPPCDPNQCTSISGQCVKDPFFIDPSFRLQLLGNSLVETTIPPIATSTLFYDYNDYSNSIQWYFFDGRWFFYNFFQLTHDYAEIVCNDNDATLAIVTDQKVLNFLVDNIMDTNEYAFVSFYSWIDF